MAVNTVYKLSSLNASAACRLTLPATKVNLKTEKTINWKIKKQKNQLANLSKMEDSIQIGDDYSKVISLLGKSECVHKRSRKDKRPAILKYDIVEFYFKPQEETQVIYGIMLQPIIEPCPEMNLSLAIGPWEKPISHLGLESLLKENKMKYEIKTNHDGEKTIKTDSGITFFLLNENTGSFVQKFGIFT